jgi:signal transduction histidine kinase
MSCIVNLLTSIRRIRRYGGCDGASSGARTISLLPGDDCGRRPIVLPADAEKAALLYFLDVKRLRMRIGDSDLILALVLLAVSQIEIWVVGNLEGPKALMVPVMVATTLSLRWRRRFPLLPPMVLAGAFGAALATFAARDEWPGQPTSLSMLAVWVITAYSVAAYGQLPVAVFGLVLTAGMSLFRAALDPAIDWDPISSLFVFIPWGTGLALRRHRRQAAELRELARQVEQEREERARAAVVEERTRIARELHDVVAHSVSVIAVQADAAEAALARDPDRSREPLRVIKETAREALVEMRRLLGILRQAESTLGLAPQPGLQQLGSLVEQTRRAGLPVELAIEGEERPLPPGVDLSAYRIVQEGLTNVRKHAGAARAWVTLRYGDRELDIAVVDDGEAEAKANGPGHGLVGIGERVGLLGGELSAGRRTEGGYELRARLPIS